MIYYCTLVTMLDLNEVKRPYQSMKRLTAGEDSHMQDLPEGRPLKAEREQCWLSRYTLVTALPYDFILMVACAQLLLLV